MLPSLWCWLPWPAPAKAPVRDASVSPGLEVRAGPVSARERPRPACASAGLSSPVGDHTVGPPAENLGSHDFLSVEGRQEDLAPQLEGGSVGGAPLAAAP